MAISNISADTIDKIRRRSAYSLPDRPSEIGMKPDEIRRAFYEAITEDNESIVYEINRIVNEINTAFTGEVGNRNTAIQTHNTSSEAHSDIRSIISSDKAALQEEITQKIATHNTLSTAHSDIRALIAAINNSAKVQLGQGSSTASGIAIGKNSNAASIAIGASAQSVGEKSVALGDNAKAQASNSVQLGSGTNTSEGTLKFLSNIIADANGNLYDDGQKVGDKYALKTGTYSNLHAGMSDEATNVSSKIGGKAISSIFESDGLTAKKASASDKATKDGSGNVITDTYVTKQEYAQLKIAEVVNELPATGVPQRIYLVPGDEPVNENLYDEYLWINGKWEMAGKAQAIVEAGTIIKIDGEKAKQLTFNSDPQTQMNDLADDIASITQSISSISGTLGTHSSNIADIEEYIDNILGNISLLANSNGGFAAGGEASAGTGGAIGNYASATTGFAGGYSAKATADGAVQLGQGTNANANTLQFRDKKIADASGNLYDAGEKLEDKYIQSTTFTSTQLSKLLALADKIVSVDNNAVQFSVEVAASSFNAITEE